MYPNKQSILLSVYPREVTVSGLDLYIPYSSIKEVKNVNENHTLPMLQDQLLLIVVGALWKKKETYLCITYNDGIQDQNPVFKLNNLDIAQREIYQRVVQERTPK